jgi:hypothetical protein
MVPLGAARQLSRYKYSAEPLSDERNIPDYLDVNTLVSDLII